MRDTRLPSENPTPLRIRLGAATGVLVAHLVFGLWLLRAAGLAGAGQGEAVGGEAAGSGMSVTFVTIAPMSLRRSEPVQAPRPDIDPMPTPTLEPPLLTPSKDVSTTPKPVIALVNPAQLAETAATPPETTAQGAAASTSADAAGRRAGSNLLASYRAALGAAIRRKWGELTDRPFPEACALQLSLVAGGAVRTSSASSCAIAQQDRQQLEAAALMAQPLPYAGYEAVFTPDLRIVP